MSAAPLNLAAYNPKGDGTSNDTAVFQEALTAAAGRTLVIPRPASKYLVGALTVPSNIRIEFEPGTILESNATLLTGTTRLLNINGANVHIVGHGATIQMVKAGFSGEQNHGVDIRNASGQIVIEGLASNATGGDGFYVNAPLADVTLRECRADDNRRQGVSVVACKSFQDYRGTYTGTTGTAPSAGVDIEPNSATDVLGPIRLIGTQCIGNDGPGIEVFLANWNAVSNYADIVLEGVYTEDNGQVSVGGRFRPGIDLNRIGSTTPCRGRIKVIDATCVEEGVAGIHVYDWDENGPEVLIVRPTVISPNQAQGSTSSIHGGIILYNSTSYTSAPGNVQVIDALVRDDAGYINAGSLNPYRVAGAWNASYVNPKAAYAGSHPIGVDAVAKLKVRHDVEQVFNSSNAITMTDWRYIGRTVTNLNASGTLTHVLPTAVVGAVLDFALAASQALRLDPASGDQIVPTGSAAGKYIGASVRGARVRLRCRQAGFWDMENVSGTWSSEP
jgi:hypothetical protein